MPRADKHKTILIIEDDAFISEMYAHLLEKNGYKIEFALDGKEGLAMAQSGHHDLILLDIMLPSLSGTDILDKLRGKDDVPPRDTKIVILTNLGQNKTTRDSLRARSDGYLVKADVVPSKLLEFVNKLLK